MISRTGALAVAATLVASSAMLSPALAHAQDEARDPEIVVDWRVTEDTGSEFQVAATVHNRTTSTYAQWAIEAPFRHAITQIEGAVSVQDESTVTISGTQPLLPGDDRPIEMSVTSTGPVSRIPSTCAVADTDCRIVVPGYALSNADPGQAGSQGPPSRFDSDSGSQTTPPESSPPTGTSTNPDLEAAKPTQPGGEGLPTTAESPEQSGGSSSDQPGAGDPNRQPGLNQGRSARSSPGQHQRVVVSVATTSDWGTGQSVSVTVRNDGPDTINDWSVEIPWEIAVKSMWNAKSTSGGSVVRASNEVWNGQLEPGDAIEFGLNGSPGTSAVPDGSCSAETDADQIDCYLVR